MWFLIRAAFWFSLVLLALPLGTGSDEAGQPSVGPLQALVAARDAVGDIAAICERKPDVCVVGQEALHTIGVRARAGAKLAYEMLDKHFDGSDASLTTGSIASAGKSAE